MSSVNPTTLPNMSLADRLSRGCLPAGTGDSLDTFKALSPERMDATPISFGKAHLGKTYRQMWDQEIHWVQWFVRTFESSGKLEHQKLIHYVTMMVERMELETESEFRQLPQPKVKAKAKSMPAHTVPLNPKAEEEEEAWMESMPLYVPMNVNTENIHALQQHTENIHALQHRMSGVENAVGEILNLLRSQK